MRAQISFSGGPLDDDFIECPFNLAWPSELRVLDDNEEFVEGHYLLRPEYEGEEGRVQTYVWQGEELLGHGARL
jgi:hypothetical protein